MISLVTCSLFRNILLNLHFFVFFTAFSCNWYLVSQCYGQKRCLIWFEFSYIYWGLICDPRCGLSWWMFHLQSRRKCILLHLDRMIRRYQWDPSLPMYHVRLFLINFLFWCSVDWCKGMLKSTMIVFLSVSHLCPLLFVLCIEELLF